MTRKLIVVILLLLILTITLQVYNIEFYSAPNPDDIYTSDDFNMLCKSNNMDDMYSFEDT
jgi:hypothetical protein